MKRILFVAVALIISQHVSAQFNKGRILAGGSAGFATNTSKSKTGSTTVTYGTSTSFSISPDAGYFIIDNLAVGASINFGVSKYNPKSNTDSETTYTGISFTPFARYYIEPGIFFQGAFGVGSAKTKRTLGSVTTEGTSNTTNWSLGAGYAYFLNDHVAVEPFLGYRMNADKSGNTKNSDGGLFLNVGFQVYLGARN